MHIAHLTKSEKTIACYARAWTGGFRAQAVDSLEINGTQLTTTAGLDTTDVRFGSMLRRPPWFSFVLTCIGLPVRMRWLQYLYDLTIVNNPQLTTLDGFTKLLVVGQIQVRNNSADLSLGAFAIYAVATNARSLTLLHTDS